MPHEPAGRQREENRNKKDFEIRSPVGHEDITVRKCVHDFCIGSRTTMRKLDTGPSKRDCSHQFRPLLPFACANPALMRESVNHPTAYSLVFGFIQVFFAQRESTVDYKAALAL